MDFTSFAVQFIFVADIRRNRIESKIECDDIASLVGVLGIYEQGEQSGDFAD
jgi:hypothetical protein